MNLRTLRNCFAALGLAAVLVWQSPAQDARPLPAGPEKAAEEGVEVLARGPVHEAYADAVVPNPEATPVVPKAPPEPIEELPPETKPEGSQWIGGYWAWDEDRSDFIWVSGFWRVPPPDRQWVPGHWHKVTDGWQWVPGVWTPVDNPEIEYTPPPPATVESGPSTPAPDDNHIYAPGCWVYRETRYVWQPGYWVVSQPGWVWVPAHYVWTPAGYVFVDGYWDYPLADRGLLFAPVAFAPRTIVQVGFTYTPSYCVRDDFLFGAMFVRPARSCYYFGDYFGPGYARAGYTPWIDFRIGRGCPDPLFGYYAHHYRGTPGWERDLRGIYVGREHGRIGLPPRTLVQQNTVINNINVHKNVNINNVKVLAPVTQITKQNLRLTQVAKTERVQAAHHAAQLRAVAQKRQAAEAGIVAKGPPLAKHDAPRHVKLDNLPAVPKLPANAKVNRTPPPPPARSRPKPEASKPPQPHPGAQPKPPVQHPQPRPGPGNQTVPHAGPHPNPPVHPKKDATPPPQQRNKVVPKPHAPPPAVHQARPAQKPVPAVKPQQTTPAHPVHPQPKKVTSASPRRQTAPPVVRQAPPQVKARPPVPRTAVRQVPQARPQHAAPAARPAPRPAAKPHPKKR